MNGCLWGNWNKFDDKTKDSLKRWIKSMETPKETNIILNPDCQGTHVPQNEFDELSKRFDEATKIIKYIFDGGCCQDTFDEEECGECEWCRCKSFLDKLFPGQSKL